MVNTHPEHTDLAFMQLALQQAGLAAEMDEVPVGAVVVFQGEVIAHAHNKQISTHEPSAHAEIMALKQAAIVRRNYRLPGCTLYVTLEPCMMCVGAMVHARIERLVFGATDPKTGVVETVDQLLDRAYHNHRVTYHGGVLATECRELLQDFFRSKRALKKTKN